MISLVTFTSSAFLLFLLFSGKALERGNGKKNFIVRAISSLDGVALKISAYLGFKWKQITQTIRYIIFIVIPRRSEEAFKNMKGSAVRNYNKQKDSLMGKKSFLNSSSASFFIKKIKEEQAKAKEGRIEEEM